MSRAETPDSGRFASQSAISSSLYSRGFQARGFWLKIWIASQPFSRPRSSALAGPPAGDTWAPMSTAGEDTLARRVLRPAPRPLRPVAHRGAAHRRRPDGALQLAARPRKGWRARPAHRGHRPRALDARERPADPRRPRVARPRLRRGTDPPERARRAPRRGPGDAPRRWPRLPLERDRGRRPRLEGGARRRSRLPRRARGRGRRAPPRARRRGDRRP